MGERAIWGQAASRYAIHQETLSYFECLQEMGALGVEAQTVEQLRGASLRRSEVFGGHVDFSGSEIEYLASSPNSQGHVPVTVYKPSNVSRVPAILVFFHGGGLVISSRMAYAPVLKTLAKKIRCLVVGVEYRLAPEHRVPAAFHDCQCAADWVICNKELIGGHAESQVGLAGDSAGGQLTASIIHDMKGLAFQILIYPITDLTMSTPSYSEFVDTPGLNTKTVEWFMKQFLANNDQITDPVVSPYFRPSFTGLPPALIILAELDPLRDDGCAYARKMQEAGVSTEMLIVRGAPHVFFHLPGHFKELCREPYDRVTKFVQGFQA